MNDIIKRNGHIAINKLFRLFSTEIEYSLPAKDNINALYVHHHSHQNWQKCHEIFVPMTSQSANALVNAQEGTASQMRFIWISRHDVPMKTAVKYDNNIYSVITKADYRGLAGMYEYYLEGRSDLNAKV